MAAPETRWLVCDLKSGLVLDELPLSSDGTISRLIAREVTQQFTLAVTDPACPPDWTSSLIPGRTMIVLVVDDVPLQGWALDERRIGGPTVPLQTSTLETCLRRTNVPNYDTPDADDLALVAATLAQPLVDRFGFTITWTPVGATNPDLQPYDNLEDQQLLSALNDLMTSDPGIEWRIFLSWTDGTRRAVTKTIQIAKKIGATRADAIFDLDADGRGCIDTYSRPESFAEGKGATMVIGVSDGSGSSRPMTDPQLAPSIAAGWPTWEERVSYANLPPDQDEDSALLNRTKTTLAQRQRGAVVWEISGDDSAPTPGVDYAEGDTVYIQVAPNPPYDPDGGSGAVRVLGWNYEPDTGRFTPVLWDDGTPEGS